MTGAEYVAKDLGMKVEAATLEQMGTARKITIRATETIRVAQVPLLSARPRDASAAPPLRPRCPAAHGRAAYVRDASGLPGLSDCPICLTARPV